MVSIANSSVFLTAICLRDKLLLVKKYPKESEVADVLVRDCGWGFRFSFPGFGFERF